MDLQPLTEAIKAGKRVDAVQHTKNAIAAGAQAQTILDAMIAAMDDVGRRFQCNEIFIPEMLMAARAMKESMALLEPLLVKAGIKPEITAVIGTVQGDQHDIGKNLVSVMWKGANFGVVDLGTNVSPRQVRHRRQETQRPGGRRVGFVDHHHGRHEGHRGGAPGRQYPEFEDRRGRGARDPGLRQPNRGRRVFPRCRRRRGTRPRPLAPKNARITPFILPSEFLMPSIGFIGAGNMAEAIARGLLRTALYQPSDICATDPSPERQRLFAEGLGVACASQGAATAAADIVILAVKPYIMGDALAQIKGSLKPTGLLISIAAGISCRFIEQAVTTPENKSPRLIRVMPNTPMLVGKGMSALCRGAWATEQDLIAAERIFAAGGKNRPRDRGPHRCRDRRLRLRAGLRVFTWPNSWRRPARSWD